VEVLAEGIGARSCDDGELLWREESAATELKGRKKKTMVTRLG
jgi:hypothetical protein